MFLKSLKISQEWRIIFLSTNIVRQEYYDNSDIMLLYFTKEAIPMDNVYEKRDDPLREDMEAQIEEMLHMLPEDDLVRIYFYIKELYFA